MENCLKTQLKATVNNDNLPILNALNATNKAYDSGTINISRDLTVRVAFSEASSLLIPSGGNFTDNSGTIIDNTISVNANTTTDIHYTNGDYKIIFKKLNKLVYIRFPDSADMSVGMHNLKISLREVLGASKDMYYLNFSLVKSFVEQEFNIENFAIFPDLLTLALTSHTFVGLFNDFLDSIAQNRTTSSLLHFYSSNAEVNIKKQDGTVVTTSQLGGVFCVEFNSGNYRIYKGESTSGTLLYDSSLA